MRWIASCSGSIFATPNCFWMKLERKGKVNNRYVTARISAEKRGDRLTKGVTLLVHFCELFSKRLDLLPREDMDDSQSCKAWSSSMSFLSTSARRTRLQITKGVVQIYRL